jgi:putative endonuclease
LAWRKLKKSKTAHGAHWERFAEQYLTRKGLRVLCRNYRCKGGEIDLVMATADETIVFIEVRYRRSSDFGTALETVGSAKQARIRRAANHYIQCQSSPNSSNSYRFDVIGISGSAQAPTLEWAQAAFY